MGGRTAWQPEQMASSSPDSQWEPRASASAQGSSWPQEKVGLHMMDSGCGLVFVGRRWLD